MEDFVRRPRGRLLGGDAKVWVALEAYPGKLDVLSFDPRLVSGVGGCGTELRSLVFSCSSWQILKLDGL